VYVPSPSQLISALREEPEDTPLQLKLNRVADMIAKVGGAAALLLFIVLLIKFLASLPGSTLDAGEKGQRFMQILIVSVTIVVVAVPEGLPLAVTLALAYATTRMLKDNNLVRVLKACETMGNATTICSDKTGTLTQNKMTVVAGTIGVDKKFGDKRQDTASLETPKDGQEGDYPTDENRLQQEVTDEDVAPMEQFFENANPEIVNLLRSSITLNSTAFEGTDEKGNKEFIGSKTETALLGLAKTYLGMENVAADRDNANIVEPIPFSSERKCMGCVVKLDLNGQTVYRLLVKGASEILLKHSNQVVDPTSETLSTHMLSEQDRMFVENTIMDYATKSLRTIGLVYRDYPEWPPRGARVAGDDKTQAEFDDIFVDMVFIGVVGIMDPLRPGVAKAVEDCRKAGVFVRMVTGDNVLTAKAIAAECGIFTRGGIVMEGPKFRTLSPTQMDQIIPRLQVLARSSPEDKRILVKRLKELGETVAVTGDGTNDGPALKMADVGFSMGIAGTEVAKEASSIILMDDNFASIVKAIMWGRCVSDAVKKFLQVSHHLIVLIIVPIDGQRHCRGLGFRIIHSELKRRIRSYGCSTTLGQLDYGYIRRLGFGDRSANT
jgi:P-type Ca2+ transporter type 2C